MACIERDINTSRPTGAVNYLKERHHVHSRLQTTRLSSCSTGEVTQSAGSQSPSQKIKAK